MEASAFYQLAIRLGTAELIHCLKIISDNTEQNTATVNADKVKKMIAAKIQTIEQLIGLSQTLVGRNSFYYCRTRSIINTSLKNGISQNLKAFSYRVYYVSGHYVCLM